jgi:hypothetical protein
LSALGCFTADSDRFGASPAAHLLDANDCYAASARLANAYSVRPIMAGLSRSGYTF